LAVTAAATLATMPLTIGLGNGVSLVSLPANLLVSPLVPVVTIVGLAAAIVGLAQPALAHLLAVLVGPFAGSIGRVARGAAAIPGSVVPAPGGPAATVITSLLLALGITLFLKRKWRWARHAIGVATVGLLTAWLVASYLPPSLRSQWPPSDWMVASCDVGQGDATLIRVPGRGPTTAILVDAGPDPPALRRCLGALGVVGLAAVILTHPHADHVAGLPAVRDMWPDQWDATPLVTSATGGPLPRELTAGHPPPVMARAGSQFSVPGIRIEVVWPARQLAESPLNNSSLVLLVTTDPVGSPGSAGLRVLLTGDVETEAQTALMAASGPPAVDVIKVAHHGSPRQHPGFVAWSGARIALISVGVGNDYGHPAPSTIALLEAAGLLVGRTDTQGGLAVVRRGSTLGLMAQR
jgi:competence protein ComEC